jgi:uncharacterized protein
VSEASTTGTKKIVMTGGTGLIGRRLMPELLKRGYEVTILTRSPETAEPLVPGASKYVLWSATERGDWEFEFNGSYAVINLAGQPILEHRWSEDFKQDIYDSRVVGTRRIVNAIRRSEHKPQVLINASAIGYYGYDGDMHDVMTEESHSGNDYFAQVCFGWELEAKQAEFMDIRVVPLRMGLVFSEDDGGLRKMVRPFKMGFGGHIEPGNQWFSWIHIDDVVEIIIIALENDKINTAINLTSPEPVTGVQLAETIGRVMTRKSWFKLPEWMTTLGLGEAAPVITHGKRVMPRLLQQLGYRFKYSTLEAALRDVIPKMLKKR